VKINTGVSVAVIPAQADYNALRKLKVLFLDCHYRLRYIARDGLLGTHFGKSCIVLLFKYFIISSKYFETQTDYIMLSYL
jgi:hypothetical protein